MWVDHVMVDQGVAADAAGDDGADDVDDADADADADVGCHVAARPQGRASTDVVG